jgi:hypothetical protein
MPASASARPVTDIDRHITAAFQALATARTSFAASPSGDGLTACLAAEEKVNELLDLRLSLRTALPRAGDPELAGAAAPA